MSPFQKTVEDFTCEHCSEQVTGNGYTNHCPKCLWSKHVDIAPGDRLETCGGMMEPMSIEGSTPNYRIVHKCAKCKAERRVDTSPNDLTQAILALVSAGADR